MYNERENKGRLTGVHAFISLLLDSQEKVKEGFVMLEEFFREGFVLWEFPVEETNSEADLGLGHLPRGHNRELG